MMNLIFSPPINSENISEKDIPTDNPANLIPDTNKENMEVHHHPHIEKNHSKNICWKGY